VQQLTARILGVIRPQDHQPDGQPRLARGWIWPTLGYLVYAATVLAAASATSPGIAALAILPIALIGMRHGTIAGLAAGLLNVPATLLLLTLANHGWPVANAWATATGLLVTAAVGALSGYVSETLAAWRKVARG